MSTCDNYILSYRVFEKIQLAYIRYQGKVTVNEILECVEIQYETPVLTKLNKRLIDFRDAQVIYEKGKNINSDPSRIRDRLNKLQTDDSKEAILIDTPGETAFFFLYADLSQSKNKEANCFSTIQAALNYLEVGMTEAEQNSLTDNMIRIEC
ncbi:MAG: hypothetical protein ACLFM1_06205 [Bacteroidales bacterium]